MHGRSHAARRSGRRSVSSRRHGLLPADAPLTRATLEEFAAGTTDLGDAGYVGPLERTARALRDELPEGATVVLLGSVASPKYRDRPVVTYCATGYRSSLAASVLERNGFREVHSVPGSMAAWRAAGYPRLKPMERAVAAGGP